MLDILAYDENSRVVFRDIWPKPRQLDTHAGLPKQGGSLFFTAAVSHGIQRQPCPGTEV